MMPPIYELFAIRRIKLEAKDGYTTHSFNSLARPIPVEDIFWSSRILITLRLICRGIIYSYSGYLLFSLWNSPSLWFVTLMALGLRWMGIYGIGMVNIPTVQELWSFHRYPQIFWENIALRVLLRLHVARIRLYAARIWWFTYLLISNMSDFEQNFLNAWSRRSIDVLPSHDSEDGSRTRNDESAERNNVGLDSRDVPDNGGIAEEPDLYHSNPEQSDGGERFMVNGAALDSHGLVLIFVGHEHLNIPILSDNIVDSILLEQLRMFYRYLKVKQGLVELVIPRSLVQINCVKLDETTLLADQVTESLDCGRGLHFFHHPETATTAQTISKRVLKLPGATPPEGLEFIRALDRHAIGGIIMAPPLALLVFVAVWLSIYLRETEENGGKVDTQVVVATAFTVASYLVTAGALITRLVAYLDNNLQATDAFGKEK